MPVVESGYATGYDENMTTMTEFPTGVQVFIETGYGLGQTLQHAVLQPFDEIHSIEVDRKIAEKAKEVWKDNDKVKIHEGDSQKVLPKIMKSSKITMFWLDAHWSFGGFGETKPVTECPLMGELEAIGEVNWREQPLILIDDAEFFNRSWWIQHPQSPASKEQWPTLDEIRDVLDDYTITERGGVLVCVPKKWPHQIHVAGQWFPLST